MIKRSFIVIVATVAAACAPVVQRSSEATPGAPFELLVLSTTDVHGRIRGWDYYADSAESIRGLTRAATIVDSIRAANPGRVLLVDAGDLLQGNPFAYVAMKQFADSANPIIAAMNAMGYDAAAIGNHEYNYGVPYLERAVSQAKFPMLSANTWKPDGTHKFKPWTIVNRQGVKIGIVGATTPGVMVWDAENVRGRVKLTDIVPAVRTAVQEVKAAGANVVIVSVHSGLNEASSYDTVSTGVPSENVSERIAKEIPGIDLVVYGHSHKEQKDLHIGSTLLVQPKNWATSVGVAHLTVSKDAGAWKVSASRGETIQSAGHAEQQGVIAASSSAHRASVAYANTVIGNTPVAWHGDSARLKDTPLVDLITEVERKATKADLASSAAFTLDAALAAGPITVARIAQLYPYDNTLRAVRISGQQLRDYLEYSARYYKSVENGRPVPDPEIAGYNFDMISGADYTIDLSRPTGSRVTSLTFKGKPVAPTDSFTLDAALAAGPITVARIAQLYPYDNTLRAVKISGKQLRDYLEYSARYYKSVENGRPVPDPDVAGYNFDMISGADYTLDLSKPIGSRVTALTFKGKAVAPTDSFTLALNNYRQTGGGGYAMLRGAPVVYDKQEEIRQLLIDEVRSRGTIKPEDVFTKNWSLVTAGGGAPATGPRLRIIATNDLHGALEPRPDNNGTLRGGAAYVAAMVEKAKKECAPGCETLLLDAGDLFQGTLVSNLSYGKPIVEYFNKLGYAAVALGNHEFDWGVDTLRARMRGSNFGIFGANVRFADGRDVPWIPDDTIIVRGRTKIGVIGIASPETPTSTLAGNVKGLRFDDPAPVIDEHARQLRSRGADFIVVLAHEGGFCNRTTAGVESCTGDIFDLAPRITEKVDLILSGHTHSQLDTRVNNIPILQARSSGTAIEVVDVPLDANGKPAGQIEGEVRNVLPSSIAPYAPVDSIVRRAVSRVARLINQRIATITTALNRDGSQYPLGNLVADAQRWAGHGDVAVTNNHGIRTGLRAGEITYGALFETQPFGNTLYSVKMSGSQLRQYFEKILGGDEVLVHVSGVAIGYDPSKPAGSRIVSLRLSDGRTMSDDATYDVVMNNFMATGGSGLGPPEGSRLEPLSIVDLDALVDYMKKLKSPINAPTEPRIFIAQ